MNTFAHHFERNRLEYAFDNRVKFEQCGCGGIGRHARLRI